MPGDHFIGVYCDDLSRELAEHFGVKEGCGIMVSRLAEKSPAEKAGVKVGDVIVRVDGKRVETRDALIDLIQDRKKGDKIKVELLRDKKSLTLEVEVDEEERGGPLSFGANSLEAWQKYADAFEQELKSWGAASGRQTQESLKRIQEDLSRQGAVTSREAKSPARGWARKI